ncbi:SUMF1/EgtB/PvdO family nonheme iron enzyme, partial [bacterium]|nr:SUMF1/EgtB/PvdO family nonheme iron enzyme [bacterium]
DNRSDLYSLGIVMYECLTGRVPYKGDNPFATIHKLINEEAEQPVQINPDIPEWLNSIVLKLIEKAPKDRFNSGVELAKAFKEKKKFTNSNIRNSQTQKFELKEELNKRLEHQSEYQEESKDEEPEINRNRTREFFTGNNMLLKAAIVLIATIIIALGSVYFYGSFSGSQVEVSNANIDAVYQAKIGKRKYNKILKKYGMQAIPGGMFWMGDNSQFAEVDAKPIRQVRISNFYIGKHEVTQSLWEEVMKNNPSIHNGTNRPVENVSWNEVQIFINRLNVDTGLKFRLLTEAEWEYAARGISKNKTFVYSGNDDLNNVGWYDENSGRKSQTVGEKQMNGFGIYDMSGNVSEWCQDWYGAYYNSTVVNPLGPRSGALKVVRGGSWYSKPDQCKTTHREAFAPSEKYNYIGFRLVLSVDS